MTELEKVGHSTDVALNAATALETMLQGASLSDLELTRVSVPGSGGTTWDVENMEPLKKLTGVVIDDYATDVFYATEYSGDNNPPDALWVDGELQYANDEARAAGVLGVSIDQEPLNQFNPTGRKAISNRWRIYLLPEGHAIPLVIEVPVMSRKPWFNFKVKAIGGVGRQMTDVVVGLSLEKAKSKSGIAYAKIVPTVERLLTPEEAEAARAHSAAFRPLTRRGPSVPEPTGDYIEGEASLADEFSAAGFNVGQDDAV